MREVRMALEGLAAEKAAPLITSDEIVVVESHYHALAAGASAGNPNRQFFTPAFIGRAVRACWCR